MEVSAGRYTSGSKLVTSGSAKLMRSATSSVVSEATTAYASFPEIVFALKASRYADSSSTVPVSVSTWPAFTVTLVLASRAMSSEATTRASVTTTVIASVASVASDASVVMSPSDTVTVTMPVVAAAIVFTCATLPAFDASTV